MDGTLFNSNLKNDKLPSWVQVSKTGPFASKEKVRYCTTVTGDLLLLPFLLRCERDNAPVRESILTV